MTDSLVEVMKAGIERGSDGGRGNQGGAVREMRDEGKKRVYWSAVFVIRSS